jgi:serine/threonine-protein kinase
MESVEVADSQRPGASSTLSKYRLVAELAEGGMGVVYLAINRGKSGFHKLLVIKELKTELARDPQFLGMFLDEARLAARLNHSNVVQTLEVGDEGDRNYLVMEYLDGQPLQKVLSRVGRSRFPVDLHIKILCDALAGLQYAHELCDYDGRPLHVVHRDVSPQNLFVTYDGQVKLVDFGIAKAMGSTHETRAGMLKGKIAYMPAEQARARAVDRRADIYAVGVMLWEAIACRRMWPRIMNDVEVLASLVVGELPRLPDHAPDAPPELVRIAERALAFDPDHRYPRADEMQADLEAYIHAKGQMPTSRDLTELLAGSFSEERTKMRSLIDARIRSLDDKTDTFELAGARRAAPLSPLGSDNSDVRSTNSGSKGSLPNAPQTGGSLTGGVLSSSLVAPAAPASVRIFGILGGVLGLLSVGALVAVLAMRSGHPAESERVVAPAAAPPPATGNVPEVAVATAAAMAAAPTVQLAVTVTPPNAKVYVDGVPVRGNPYSGAYPMDHAHHRLSAESSGYETKRTDVVFDRDMSVSIALEKQAISYAAPVRAGPRRAAPSVEVEVAPPPPPQKPAEPEARAPARPSRGLYGEDPYVK